MTGSLAEHTPEPLPLVQRYYNALGFDQPFTEFDPSTGTYQAQATPEEYAERFLAGDNGTHLCGADPADCARWTAELLAQPADTAEWHNQLEAS